MQLEENELVIMMPKEDRDVELKGNKIQVNMVWITLIRDECKRQRIKVILRWVLSPSTSPAFAFVARSKSAHLYLQILYTGVIRGFISIEASLCSLLLVLVVMVGSFLIWQRSGPSDGKSSS